jgi:hypothetical protein
MTEVDRTNLLHELNSRHEDVLHELEALARSLESALATVRPPSDLPSAAPTAAGPNAPTC